MKQVNSNTNLLENVCIKVPKVYDWVNRQVDLPLICFSGIEGLRQLAFDCNGATPGGVDDPCLASGNNAYQVNCFLSDELGNPVNPDANNAFICQEIIQPKGRQDITATLPTGETVTLQKVKALVKGHVVVETTDLQGNVVCTSDPIPFATAQTFFLCAPEGTRLDCHVSFFECDASIICQNGTFQQLDVSITLCLEAQMESTVKLEIAGKLCQPRAELPVSATVCFNEFPPQCPEVFPGHNTHC